MLPSLQQILKSKKILSSSFFSNDKLIPAQCSVACILKPSKQSPEICDQWNYDVLLLRRKPNPKDNFSGQVCFPGGKVQKNQSQQETAIRQTYEQTGIKLNQKNLIQKVHKNFSIYVNQKLTLFVRCFIFQLFEIQPKVQVCQRQIQSFTWFPIRKLILGNNTKIFRRHIQYYPIYPLQQFLNETQQKIKIFNKAFEYTDYPALQVGLPVYLFGMTYYCLIYIVGKTFDYMNQNYTLPTQMTKNATTFLTEAVNFKIKCKENTDNKKQIEQFLQQNWAYVFTMYLQRFSEASPKL